MHEAKANTRRCVGKKKKQWTKPHSAKNAAVKTPPFKTNVQEVGTECVPNVPVRAEQCVHRYRMFPALYRTASCYQASMPALIGDASRAKKTMIIQTGSKRDSWYTYKNKTDSTLLCYTRLPTAATQQSIAVCQPAETQYTLNEISAVCRNFLPLGRTVGRTVGRTRMSVYDLTQL